MVAPGELSAIMALKVPAASEPMAAVTVIVPFPLPEFCESVNQGALSLAIHVSVPPPVLLMLSVWAAGFPPPCCAVKDRVVGIAAMRGGTGASATMNVTGTEVFLAPGALMVIAPLYVPTANEPVAALILIAPLLVPEAGESVNQAALSLAVQVSVPPPVLLMFSVWVAGLPLPRWTVKEKLVGLVPMAGGTGAGATVKLTGMVIAGVPTALTVIVVL